MKKRIILIAAMALCLSVNAQQGNPLLKNEARITEIIKSMTLEEKVNMLHGKNMFSSAGVERLGIPDIEYADGPFGIREEMEKHSWKPLELENALLQNYILRDEWGFKGIIISDWDGTHSTVGAAIGGLDVEMPGNTFMGQALIDSVKTGAVPMEVIDAKVRNLLRVRFAIPAIPKEESNKKMTSQPETQAVAYMVASKSIVLLKNEDNLLPVGKKVKTILVVGDNATRKMAQGGVGAGVKTLYEVTPLEGIQKAFKGKAKNQYVRGYEPKPRRRWHEKQEPDLAEWNKNSVALRKEAVDAAKKADLVVFMGGNNREVETEGSDRKDINLPF